MSPTEHGMTSASGAFASNHCTKAKRVVDMVDMLFFFWGSESAKGKL
jgi:hypothetical protein